MDSQGDSWILFAIKGVTEGDNKYPSKWIEQWLDETMGTRPQLGPHMWAAMTSPTANMPAQFAAELGKGVALGLLKSLGPLKTPLLAQGGTTITNCKQTYGEEDIAALMVFSKVPRKGHQRLSAADTRPHETVVT
jgi:hypothetical protein